MRANLEKSRGLISDVVCTGVLRALESNKGKKLFYSKGRIHLEFISKNIFKRCIENNFNPPKRILEIKTRKRIVKQSENGKVNYQFKSKTGKCSSEFVIDNCFFKLL